MTQAFILFHLNLAYSSIPAEQHEDVIEKCYAPLLQLCETAGLVMGIELTGWTLQRISGLNPGWVSKLRRLIGEGRVELIGSGYTQLIGPLVPYEVNVWNQHLGLEVYQGLLNVTPRLALVNEMAYSTGMLVVYREVGYEGLVMDRDNIVLALEMSDQDAPFCYADDGHGNAFPVLWSDSILFQKFQRYAHGDIRLRDYLAYFRQRTASAAGPLPVYCNDVEIFDYRPGRFKEEPGLRDEGEWSRIRHLLDTLSDAGHVDWLSPSRALQTQCSALPGKPRQLTSACQPIPVKKQAKYNVSRWAVTGRNDLWANTMCHRLYKALKDSDRAGDHGAWRQLCELWASDIRTHITQQRWDEACRGINAMAGDLGVAKDFVSPRNYPSPVSTEEETLRQRGVEVGYDPEGLLMTITSTQLRLELNLRRGLTIHSLAFRHHDFVPTVGTLPHGYFQSIKLGADFYSAGVVVELLTGHRRITDLEWVKPVVSLQGDLLQVSAEIATGNGIIRKQIGVSLDGERLTVRTDFPAWERPYGTVRVGTLTLLPEAFSLPLYLAGFNGGRERETMRISKDCHHHGPSSSLVSCTTGLGGAGGELLIGDEHRGLTVAWDPANCAAFPLLHHQACPPSALTRITFSLCEVDETYRPGGALPGFQYHISPNSGVRQHV